MLTPARWAVELDAFGKSYAGGWAGPARVAVHAISLQLAPGQVLGLLGPNGSGKSTTLKALAGLVRPFTGACGVGGAPPGSDAARRRIGYLPEALRPPPRQTAREWLRFCAGLSLPRERVADRVTATLARVGLATEADRALGSFSKGMRQRLGLAQAIVHEPEVVLLDEPASGLDPQGRQLLLQLIRELAAAGTTVVFTAHLLASLETICDRIVILAHGRVLADGAPAELLGVAPGAAPSPLEMFYLEKTRDLA